MLSYQHKDEVFDKLYRTLSVILYSYINPPLCTYYSAQTTGEGEESSDAMEANGHATGIAAWLARGEALYDLYMTYENCCLCIFQYTFFQHLNKIKKVPRDSNEQSSLNNSPGAKVPGKPLLETYCTSFPPTSCIYTVY